MTASWFPSRRCRMCEVEDRNGISLLDSKYSSLSQYLDKHLNLRFGGMYTNFLCQDCFDEVRHWKGMYLRHQASQLYFQQILAMLEAVEYYKQLEQAANAPPGAEVAPVVQVNVDPPQQANLDPPPPQVNLEPAVNLEPPQQANIPPPAVNLAPPAPKQFYCASCLFHTKCKTHLRIHMKYRHTPHVIATRRKRR